MAPRTGKTKVAIDVCNNLKRKNILITYPENSIKTDTWLKEILKWKLKGKPTFTNQRSIIKYDLNDYDQIVVDEIHTLSDAQLSYFQGSKIPILGMSGSYSEDTITKLKKYLKLNIIYDYPIEQAIEDKIIADYEINIMFTSLNERDKYIKAGNKKNPFLQTEKGNYDYLTKQFNLFKIKQWNAEDAKEAGAMNNIKLSFASKRRHLLATCKSKLNLAKQIIGKTERCLVFTGFTNIADELAPIAYHSKSKGDELELFQSEKHNKLALIKMANAGITFNNLKCAIFHHLNSNPESAVQKVLRTMNIENETDRKASIYICCIKDTVDEQWMIKAISMLNPKKINYYYGN